MSRVLKRKIIVIVTILLCFMLSACIGLVPSPFRPNPGPLKSPDVTDLAQAFEVVCRNYRLGPDDLIRVIYQTKWNIPSGTYVLDTLDEVDLEFILDPALNRKVRISPDGTITLPGAGEIQAAGLTPEELGRKIEDEFRKRRIFVKDETGGALDRYKRVTVHVTAFFQKIRKLVESLTTLTAGQQLPVLVNPDGNIDLPLLQERVMAAGQTVREVEKKVNELYNAGPLKYAVVSLSLVEAKSRKVYVLGEVNNPGAYELKQPVTALHALALAGGHIASLADLTSVILISKDINGKPIGRRLDLKRIVDVGDTSSAILVKPYDVLFVPRTYIGDVRLFMEQYVRTVTDFATLSGLFRGE
jgi:polysaccharide biosynthesis/export protein